VTSTHSNFFLEQTDRGLFYWPNHSLNTRLIKMIFNKWIMWDLSCSSKIPCGSPTFSERSVNYHQDFVASMHSDFFLGQTDRGLFNWPNHFPNTRLIKMIFNKLIKWGLSWWSKIPCGSPAFSERFVNYHQDIVASTHSNFFLGYTGRGLFYCLIIPLILDW
jgi:hypothetical protein